MPITDGDQLHVVRLLVHDLHETVGTRHDQLAIDNAIRLREFLEGSDADDYVQRVVDATQQDIHDEFIDTTWPKCPRHAHPLWCHHGWWLCERDHLRIAPLGGLASRAGWRSRGTDDTE